jgi:hypothetical protein
MGMLQQQADRFCACIAAGTKNSRVLHVDTLQKLT